jgi:hypothetical protein
MTSDGLLLRSEAPLVTSVDSVRHDFGYLAVQVLRSAPVLGGMHFWAGKIKTDNGLVAGTGFEPVTFGL